MLFTVAVLLDKVLGVDNDGFEEQSEGKIDTETKSSDIENPLNALKRQIESRQPQMPRRSHRREATMRYF